MRRRNVSSATSSPDADEAAIVYRNLRDYAETCAYRARLKLENPCPTNISLRLTNGGLPNVNLKNPDVACWRKFAVDRASRHVEL